MFKLISISLNVSVPVLLFNTRLLHTQPLTGLSSQGKVAAEEE